MKERDFKPSGICASRIHVTLDDNDIVRDLQFTGGCDGNHKGLRALIIGMPAQEAIQRMSGITCGFKRTSCPDQASLALRQALGK